MVLRSTLNTPPVSSSGSVITPNAVARESTLPATVMIAKEPSGLIAISETLNATPFKVTDLRTERSRRTPIGSAMLIENTLTRPASRFALEALGGSVMPRPAHAGSG
ncbi:MAG: hypothetical protein BWY82_02121 [Verrucomicrobia bacterium ADurb.Bin474]|nr:MAG: hypothetical protein BWY82_02121 [Verrucomicrobia bacterium ADurb.Bin474]